MSFAVVHRMPRTSEQVAQWTAAGVTRFEADVQLAGDTVVVSHFLPLLRVRGWVQHDGLSFRWRSGRRRDPTLLDALRLLPADATVLLDPKETEPGRRARLADALAAGIGEPGRAVVSTDDERDLGRYRATGFATWRTVKDARGLQAVLRGDRLPDAGVSIRHTLLDQATVERLNEVAGVVVAWTVNDASRARELTRFGVDGVTTDRLEVGRMVSGVDGSGHGRR